MVYFTISYAGPEELTLYVTMSTDPFQPFGDDSKYSITPFVLTLANSPLHIRWKPGMTTILTLIPGSRSKSVKVML